MSIRAYNYVHLFITKDINLLDEFSILRRSYKHKNRFNYELTIRIANLLKN